MLLGTHTISTEVARRLVIAAHCRPPLATFGLQPIALEDRREDCSMTGCVGHVEMLRLQCLLARGREKFGSELKVPFAKLGDDAAALH